MGEFSKRSEISARFERSEARNLSMTGSSYSNNFTVTTTNGDTISLQFKDRKDLKEFLDAAITLALKFHDREEYMSEYVAVGQAAVGVETVLNWQSDTIRWKNIMSDALGVDSQE
jgi:hypothetical protein